MKAARSAFGGWSGRTAYNRGQVVYRIAEVLEDRREQFEAELRTAEGITAAKARTYVDASIDRLVWYAGWADKIAQVIGGANQVAGPYFNHSAPEPSGVIAVVAPKGPLLGLVSVIAPVIVTGNTAVVVASEPHPLTSITLAEVMAASDVPGGVVNILTGPQAEVAPWLASHMDVNGIDLTGVDDLELARSLEVDAAENLKRVRRPGGRGPARGPGPGPDDDLPGDQDGLAPDGDLTPAQPDDRVLHVVHHVLGPRGVVGVLGPEGQPQDPLGTVQADATLQLSG